MRRWTQIFKGLANITRLKIILLLSDEAERTVSEIAREVHVSFKGASRHLRLLSALDILTEEGKDSHVFYAINRKMPPDMQRAVNIFVK